MRWVMIRVCVFTDFIEKSVMLKSMQSMSNNKEKAKEAWGENKE